VQARRLLFTLTSDLAEAAQKTAPRLITVNNNVIGILSGNEILSVFTGKTENAF
jgi:hypothetical protein